jgi:hypothetical protein
MGEPLSERDDGRESGRSGLHQDDSPFSALLAQVGGAPPTTTGSWAGVGADAAGSWPRGGHGVSPFGGVEWPGAGRGVPSASGAPLAGTGWYGGPWPRPGAASCPPPGPAVGLARPQLPSACPALPLALPWLLASHRLPSTILGNNSTLQRQLFLVLIGGRRYLSNMTVSKYALLLLAVVAEVVDDHAHKSLQLLLLLPHRIVSTRLIQGISFFWILQVSHCCLSCYTHTYCWFN